MIDYCRKMAGIIRLSKKKELKKPTSSSQWISTVNVPSQLLSTSESHIQLLVSSDIASRIHQSFMFRVCSIKGYSFIMG